MSLINQMLNELERRGVGNVSEEQAVRAVAVKQQRSRYGILLLLVFLVLAYWVWRSYHNVSMLKDTLPTQEFPVLQVESPAPQATRVSVPQPLTKTAQIELVTSQAKAKVMQPRQSEQPQSMQNRPLGLVQSVASATPLAPTLDVPIKQSNPHQQADYEYQKALQAMQQGRISDALAGYEKSLQLYPAHDEARRALVAWSLENKRLDDAERLLVEELRLHPKHSNSVILLARLQVERNDLEGALNTLQASLSYANRQADYQAFVGTVFQRLNRHTEAIPYYQNALQLAPDNAVWLMGLGISLQATQRNTEARDVLRRAVALHQLTPDLQVFVEQRMKELSP